MLKQRLTILYEGTMILLVIISLVVLMSNDESNFRYVHQAIWGVFLIDVGIRFIRTSVKWRYIKDNPFDLVTVLPLEDIMLLGRFARFLRLFRYKNLLKRYVDGISRKLEVIGFFRLSIGVLAINLLVILSLKIFSRLTFVESAIWVWANFLKFNYQTSTDSLIVLSIIIKIFGLIYFGIVIKALMMIGRSKYEEYRARKRKEAKLKEETT